MRFALAALPGALALASAHAHDSWINGGGYRNGAGEWCCGMGDCFIVPKENVGINGRAYVLTRGPIAGMGPTFIEEVPFSEAQPSPDGEFWRCRRPDGSRRCFFAPPPST